MGVLKTIISSTLWRQVSRFHALDADNLMESGKRCDARQPVSDFLLGQDHVMSRWPSLPLSIRDFPLSQFIHLKNQEEDSVLRNLTYPAVALSMGDAKDVLGISADFERCLPQLPTLSVEEESSICASTSLLIGFTFASSHFGSLVARVEREIALDVETFLPLDTNQLDVSSELGNELGSGVEERGSPELSEADSPRPKQRKRHRPNKDRRIPHAPSSDTRHKTRIPLERRKTGGRREEDSLAKLWDGTFGKLSPSFSLVEKALLNDLVLSVKVGDLDLKDISDLDFENYPFEVLEKVWNVICAALQRKGGDLSNGLDRSQPRP